MRTNSFAATVIVILSSGILKTSSSSSSQYFLERPANQTVREGEDIVLRCRVGNLQGRVQWTRKGFAMGYSDEMVRSICPSCQLMGDPSSGQFNLQVKSVRLGQDEEFECQVLPGPAAPIKVPLRASVHLEIQVPPKSVMLREPPARKAGSKLSLACTAEDSNPKTTLLWFKGDKHIQDAESSEDVYVGSRPGTFTTVSKISLVTTAEDDDTVVRCKAEHPAVTELEQQELHLEDQAVLTVLYPPRAPFLKGDLSSEKRIGDKVSLECLSAGGNPMPELTWLRNGAPLPHDFAIPVLESTPKVRQMKSFLSFNASRSDHMAIFACRSFSAVMTEPIVSLQHLRMNVTFPPARVTIVGPDTAKVDETPNLRCLAQDANPAPSIQWVVNGRKVGVGVNTNRHPQQQKADVTSDLRLEVGVNDSRIAVTCLAVSRGHFGDVMTEKAEKEILVLKPPSSPVISGLPQNYTLREGQSVELSCSSLDGSPQPSLRWFLGAEELTKAEFSNKPHSESKLKLIASREDNVREYRCEASNDANLNRPVSSRVRFNVFFAPESIRIDLERVEEEMRGKDRTETFKKSKKFQDDSFKIVMAGELIRLICLAGSSKPRPLFRWVEDGSVLREANKTVYRAAKFDGEELYSVLEFRAQPEHNNKIYECFAHNPTITEPHEKKAKITLIVLFKPTFLTSELLYTVVEGETKQLSLKASGNPPEIQYSWSFPSSARFSHLSKQQHLLTVTEAGRNEAGNYTVTAANSYGDFNTSVVVRLDVLFPPTILSLTPEQTVIERDEVAVFTCQVESNPFTEDTVSWVLPDRPGGPGAWKNRKEVIVNLENKTSILRIHFANRLDGGRVVCSANNKVKGVVAEKTTKLIVYHSPQISKDPQYSKYAVGRGSPALLVCRALSVPLATFSWRMTSSFKSKTVDPSDPSNGETVLASRFPMPNVVESVLKLDNVRVEHYSSEFRCEASNEYGSDIHTIALVPPGPPDAPVDVNIESTAPTTVALSWTPGFDGGFNQSFVLTVLDQKTGVKVKEVSLGGFGNETTVDGLRPHTSYIIKIQSKNKAGLSDHAEEVFVKTRSLENAVVEEEILPRVAITAIVLLIIFGILAAVVFVVCCCRKWRKKQQQRQQHQRSHVVKEAENRLKIARTNSNKSLIIERYTPSKYNSTLFYPSFDSSHLMPARSNSTSSSGKVDYKELARSLSMPGGDHDSHDHLDSNDGDDEALNGLDSGRYSSSFLANGDPFHTLRQQRHSQQRLLQQRPQNRSGSCSQQQQHNAMGRRQSQRLSSIGCNTTLEDEVFEDSPSSPVANPFKSVQMGGGGGRGTFFGGVFPQRIVGSRLASSGNDSGFFATSTFQYPPPPSKDSFSPCRKSQFSFTRTAAAATAPNGHACFMSNTLGRQRTPKAAEIRRMNSADRLDSPPLPPPPPPPPPMASFRHLNFTTKPSLIV